MKTLTKGRIKGILSIIAIGSIGAFIGIAIYVKWGPPKVEPEQTHVDIDVARREIQVTEIKSLDLETELSPRYEFLIRIPSEEVVNITLAEDNNALYINEKRFDIGPAEVLNFERRLLTHVEGNMYYYVLIQK